MKATVKMRGPGWAWRTVNITHRNRVTLREGEWLESLTYWEGGPFKLIDDDGLPVWYVWYVPQQAPVFIRFGPWVVPSGIRLRRAGA